MSAQLVTRLNPNDSLYCFRLDLLIGKNRPRLAIRFDRAEIFAAIAVLNAVKNVLWTLSLIHSKKKINSVSKLNVKPRYFRIQTFLLNVVNVAVDLC